MKFHIPCIVIFYIASLFALTEKEAVLLGLKNNKEIQIRWIDIRNDSLALASLKAGWLPSASALLSEEISPLNHSTIPEPGENTPKEKTMAIFTTKQVIPGGGNVSGSISGNYEKNLLDSVFFASNSVQFTYTQPLLRQAWKNHELKYRIDIKRFDNSSFSLHQQKMIISQLSQIRSLYWTLYEKKAFCSIYKEKEVYRKKQLETERARFGTGQASALDTLSAAFDYLESKRLLLSAQTDVDILKQGLATMLSSSVESILVDTLLLLSISPIPNPEKFLEMAKAYDPELKIFELMKKKLNLQYQNNKNQFLPNLEFKANYSRVFFKNQSYKENEAKNVMRNASVSLIASYSLPLKLREIDKQKIKLEIKKNIVLKDNYYDHLKNKIAELSLMWQRDMQTLEIFQISIDIADKKYIASKAGYDLGTVNRLTLDKAEDDYVESKLRFFQKQVIMKKLEIIFDEITGSTLSRFGVTLK